MTICEDCPCGYCGSHDTRYGSAHCKGCDRHMEHPIKDRCSVCRRPKPTTNGKVYFISDGTYVKIGFTGGKVTTRRDQLQTGHPLPLKVLGWIEETLYSELALQAKFRKHRVNGEWFRLCDDIGWFVANECRK